jgi:signal recognition particle GTPase
MSEGAQTVGWFKRKDDAPARQPEGEAPNETPPRRKFSPACGSGAVPDTPQPVRRPGAGAHRQEDRCGVLDQIEELLITSDIGVQTATALIGRISSAGAATAEDLRSVLREEILAILTRHVRPARAPAGPPHVILVVGVNGVGKTTTIGKLAARLAADGQKVLIAAADTFRAAAVEQLTIWAERAGADIVRHPNGADPAAVAFDAVDTALARGADVVIVDTAGRLHTKVNLMEEIKKVKRSIAKKLPEAPHDPAGPGRAPRPERHFPGPAVSRSAGTDRDA